MSTLTVPATLMHPEQRERSVDAELLVDTGATYTLLPPDLVRGLELSTPDQQRAILASGESVVYRVGEVRIRLHDRERTTVFIAGAPGSRPLLGAVALEQLGLAADSVSGRLLPAPPALL
jgi:aspartyl protease family protein